MAWSISAFSSAAERPSPVTSIRQVDTAEVRIGRVARAGLVQAIAMAVSIGILTRQSPMLPGGVQLGALKLELGPPIGVAPRKIAPNFSARLLAQGIALCRFSYPHAGLIAAASVPVGGHRRRRADHEGP